MDQLYKTVYTDGPQSVYGHDFHGSKMESAAGMANINFNKKSLETFGL